MTIGERIKITREKLGMSQVDFADKIDVSKQTLYKYENNIITNVPSDKIEAIARIGNVTPSYIMGWDEPEHPSYYDDPEIQELANFMHKNPEYKVLFDASKNVKKEDIEFVKEFMDRMRGEFDDTGC